MAGAGPRTCGLGQQCEPGGEHQHRYPAPSNGNARLNAIAGTQTQDAAILEATFVPRVTS